MVRSLGSRLHLLQKLMDLKCGPGAAILPPNVTRIHMDFAIKVGGGHMGPRQFWRQYLPRLKYHNPLIPMIVNRHTDQSLAPKMTIYFSSGAASSQPEPLTSALQPASSRLGLSKAQPPTADEKIVTIDMKDVHSEAILEQFLSETKATVLKPDEAEVKQLQELEKLRRLSAASKARVGAAKDEREKEKKRLEAAVELGKALEDAA